MRRQSAPVVIRPQVNPPARLPRNYIEAARGLVDQRVNQSQKARDYRSMPPLEHVHADMATFARKFMKECADRGIPLRVFQGYRSPKEQQRMKDRGVSRAGPGQSPHQYGCAVDMIHVARAWEGMTREQWDVLGAIGKEVARRMGIDVDWGGDWDFYDPAHWQLTDWKEWRAYHDQVGEKTYRAWIEPRGSVRDRFEPVVRPWQRRRDA